VLFGEDDDDESRLLESLEIPLPEREAEQAPLDAGG
jgi:hypothetical protein